MPTPAKGDPGTSLATYDRLVGSFKDSDEIHAYCRPREKLIPPGVTDGTRLTLAAPAIGPAWGQYSYGPTAPRVRGPWHRLPVPPPVYVAAGDAPTGSSDPSGTLLAYVRASGEPVSSPC